MANLYELMGDYDALQNAIDEAKTEEEITQILDQVDEAKGPLRDKVDNIARLLANLEGNTEKIRREERRLADRRKATENNVKRLRNWVKSSMDVLDVKKIQTALHTVQILDGQPKVVVLDDALVPDDFCRITREVDKTKVLKTYRDNGEIVQGCDIVPGEPKLVIR